MASSTTNLDLISSSQASKEITANALFDAESPAALYGRRASTTANLTWGYYGGAMSVNGIVTAIPNGTKTLTNGATNYLEADPTTGNVAVNTSNFTAANIPLYSVVCAGNVVTSYTDYRPGMGPSIIDTVTVGITANGSTLATATALTTIFNKISTANTGTGVRLPSGLVSPRSIYIDNDTANAVNVYPFAGAAINTLTANAPYVIPAGSGGMFTYTAVNQFDTFLAGSGGAAGEVFSVATGTDANHAARLDQVSLMPSVAANTTTDIFGAAGVTINLTGNGTVTAFSNCSSGQVGSVKKIICASTPTFNASASLTIDGATSGSVAYPANAELEVLATSTSTFALKTVNATASFTGTATGFNGAAPTMTLTYVRKGNVLTLKGTTGVLTGTSNATTKTVTGFPAIAIPVNSQYNLLFSQDNGGAWQPCTAIMGSGGALIFYKDASGNAFTASGTASLAVNTITYLLN